MRRWDSLPLRANIPSRVVSTLRRVSIHPRDSILLRVSILSSKDNIRRDSILNSPVGTVRAATASNLMVDIPSSPRLGLTLHRRVGFPWLYLQDLTCGYASTRVWTASIPSLGQH